MSTIKKSAVIYYFILFVALLLTWARQDFLPMPLRIVYMALVFVPVLINRISFYFPCLVLFLITSLLSFAGYTFMPTEITIYVIISLVFAAAAYQGKRNYYFPYPLLLLILFFTIVINLFLSNKIERVSYAFFIFVLLPITVIGKDKENVVGIIPKCFIFSTVACALLTLLNQQLLIEETKNYDRIVSGSINYTCCTLGIGFVFALREFMNTSSTKLQKVFYAFCMLILFVTVILEASRGAALAIALSTVLIVFSRQRSLRVRILTIVVASFFVVVLYNNQMFDTLIYRIQSDEGTGTGRTEIWSEKLDYFLNHLTFSNTFFGLGYEKTWNLGGYGRGYIGCHNDFLAFFLEYGLLGLLSFFALLITPFRIAKTRGVRIEILPIMAYIVTVCMTLEPFSIGYLPFFFILLYIYLVVGETKLENYK